MLIVTLTPYAVVFRRLSEELLKQWISFFPQTTTGPRKYLIDLLHIFLSHKIGLYEEQTVCNMEYSTQCMDYFNASMFFGIFFFFFWTFQMTINCGGISKWFITILQKFIFLWLIFPRQLEHMRVKKQRQNSHSCLLNYPFN